MINLVRLGGTLIKDPVIRDGGRDLLVAEFTVASKRVRFNASTRTDEIDQVFISCMAWEDAAEQVARLGQGAVVLVEGQLTQMEVERNGKKERKTKVQALVVQVVRTPPEDRATALTGDDQYPG